MKNTNVKANGHGSDQKANVTKKDSFQLKNLLSNVEKNGIFRFQIGLIITLALVYGAFQITSSIVPLPDPPPLSIDESSLYSSFQLAEIKIEKVEEKQKSAPKKVFEPTKFEIIDDNETAKVETELLAQVSAGSDDGVTGIDYAEPVDDVDVETVLMDLVDEAPIFPGCEKVAENERVACFQKQLQKHIRRKFRYPDAAVTMQQQGRVTVLFKVGATGVVEDVKMRGPHKILETEARRIMSSIPKMTPGKQKGRAVKVSYTIPINFQLN